MKTVRGLYSEAVLNTIAMAAYVAPIADANLLEGWDGDTYLLNNGSGDAGAVTFRAGEAVGAFFNHENARSPYRDDGNAYDLERYFDGAPAERRQLAETQALQFLLQDLGDRVLPVITTALWSVDGQLHSVDSWADFDRHSGQLLKVDFDYYELPANRVTLVKSIHERKMADTEQPMPLTNEEMTRLFADGAGGKTDAAQLLAAVGIQTK